MNTYKTYRYLFMVGLAMIVMAIIANDVEDTLVHHYDRSVFAPLGHDSYWYPDWTRKYVDGDPEKGRISVWIFPVPAFMFDAWHLIKVIRQALWFHGLWCVALWCFAAIPRWDGVDTTIYLNVPDRTSRKQVRAFYIFTLAVYMITIYLSHKLWYGWWLLK